MRTRSILGALLSLVFAGTAHAADCQPEFVERDYSIVVSGVRVSSSQGVICRASGRQRQGVICSRAHGDISFYLAAT